MKLTPEDFEKLETKELANIIRKLGAGKTLTKREEEKLEGAKQKDAAGEVNFANTWDELARILAQRLGVSVTRRSLQTWRSDPRYVEKWPRDRADGRKDIVAWMKFIRDHGLNRADEMRGDEDGEQLEGEPRTTNDWKKRQAQLQCQKIERSIAREDQLLLVATDLEVPLGAMLMAVQNKISQFAPRVSRFIVGLRDEHEAEEKLHYETDAILADLNVCGYLDDSLAKILAELPFDKETEKLFESVTFGGQDRQSLFKLVELIARETLRRIGRAAIAAERMDSVPGPIDADPAANVEAVPSADSRPTNSKPPAPPAKAARTESSNGALPGPKKSRGKRGPSTSRRKK